MSERAAAASFAEALAKLEEYQKLRSERDEYKKLYTHLREENERLKRGLLGKKAEKLPQNDAQLSLAILGLMLGGGEEPASPPAEEEETQVIPEHTRKVPKRRGPSDDWPRVYIELVPPEVEREGLDAFDVIGQESRGVLERRPASCVFVEVVRKKFVRKADKGATDTSVLIADPLALPIAKGIAGPGLLAETVVKHWCDHQPLHRQESIFARDGLELARSTLSEWHHGVAVAGTGWRAARKRRPAVGLPEPRFKQVEVARTFLLVRRFALTSDEQSGCRAQSPNRRPLRPTPAPVHQFAPTAAPIDDCVAACQLC